MMGTVWTLAIKDLRLFFRDRTVLLLTLFLPIALSTVFGSAMAGMMGGDSTPTRLQLLVEDLDKTENSAKLIAAFEERENLRIVPFEDVERSIRNGHGTAGVIIPKGWGAELDAGTMPNTRLCVDPSSYISRQVVAIHVAYATGSVVLEAMEGKVTERALDVLDFPEAGRERADEILAGTWTDMDELMSQLKEFGAFSAMVHGDVREADAPVEGEKLAAGPPSDSDPELALEAATDDVATDFDFMAEMPSFVGIAVEEVVGEHESAPESGGASHAFAAMAVMMLMFSVMGAGGTLIEERQGGTLMRLNLAPGAGGAILMGKFVMISIVGMLQLTVLFTYGAIFFDVPIFADPATLLLTMVIQVYTTTALGLFFATWLQTQKQLESVSTVVILVMSAVGGAWFPREITPEWFQTAGLFTITAWAMDAYHGVLWYGKGLVPKGHMEGIWSQLTVLFLIGLVLHLLALRFYRTKFVVN
jgi:ABC-2 type transport system permease protein